MAHDAGTGYLKGQSLTNDWFKTQNGNLSQQLDCGARSLDIRPSYQNGSIHMHHGIVEINTNLSTGLDDVESWCLKNKGELVLLYINSCEGDGCDEQTRKLIT